MTITSAREKDNPSRRDSRKFQNQRQSASNARYHQQEILASLKPAVTVVANILILKIAQPKAKNIHARR